MWCWEKSDSFDLRLQELQGKAIELPMSWVDCFGNPVKVSGEVAACNRVRLQRIPRGELIGDISELLFRDPNCFRAGELHNHFEYWQYIARDSSSPRQAQILGWIRDKVSIKPFFKHKYNTLPFGWKISPFVYHTTGLLASNFLRATGIPCLLYIDDRHNGELQVALDKGEYATINTVDDRHLAAARSAIFLVAYHLVSLGYFLDLQKSILFPSKVVPYLGLLADSSREVFSLKPEKKEKFLQLVREILHASKVTVKTLQRLVGKCVSFSLAVPAAQLFTKQMNAAIAGGQRTPHRLIPIRGYLREEISHWLFLEGWDDPVTWRDERHIRVSVATEASASGWGAILLAPHREEISDYWTEDQCK